MVYYVCFNMTNGIWPFILRIYKTFKKTDSFPDNGTKNRLLLFQEVDTKAAEISKIWGANSN